MKVYNAKLLPSVIIELAAYYRVKVLATYYKMPYALRETTSHCNGIASFEDRKITLCLQSIEFNHWHHREYWDTLLWVFLHEVGHLEDRRCPAGCSRKKIKEKAHQYSENFADKFAQQERARLLSLSDTLFEPEYLGIFEILERKRHCAWCRDKEKRFSASTLSHIRSRRVHCQYALSEVVSELFNLFPQQPNYRRVRKALQDYCERLNLGKVYTDGAGRKHRFFTFGDLEFLKNVEKRRIRERNK